MSDDRINDKLVASKQQWAKDGRLLTGKPGMDRLPPGQRLVTNWPVLDLGIQPHVPRETWRLDIGGAVANPVSWDWQTFCDQPAFEDVSDIHCVTQWSRYDNRWQGVSTRHVLETVQPDPDAQHVLLESYDGYTTNITLDVFAGADCLLAHSHDGTPLSREHGGPVRLVVPRYYFWKSAKWLRAIRFVAADRPGFWEVRGYHNQGDPWDEERYS
jgi:DMSO/TMAO reductase YedYZ molybdopterin-dependent catalytic subunit